MSFYGKLARSGYSRRKINFLKSGEYADVTFVFEESKSSDSKTTILKAHTLLLTLTSEVFEKMFYGDFPREDAIKVSDIGPQVFEMMLKFIYGDYVVLDDVTTTFELYKAADKYALFELVEDCETSLRGNIRPATALQIYEFAKFYSLDELTKLAMHCCKVHAKEVLANFDLLAVSPTTIESLFKQDQLNIDSEIQLLDAAVKYIECRRSCEDYVYQEEDTVVAEMMGAFSNIRFKTLTSKEVYESRSVRLFTEYMQSKKSFALASVARSDTDERCEAMLPDGFDLSLSKRMKIPKVIFVPNVNRHFFFRKFTPIDYLYNNDGNLRDSVGISSSTPCCLMGVQVATQLRIATKQSHRQIRNIRTYMENLDLTLTLKDKGNIAKKNFVDEFEFDTYAWLNFDEPINILEFHEYALTVHYRTFGYYPHNKCRDYVVERGRIRLNVSELKWDKRAEDRGLILAFKLMERPM